jgi:hypothetical protein
VTAEQASAERAVSRPEPEEREERVQREETGGGSDRRPCPMCGEMIAANAAKCRFCGEIFDPTLLRLEKSKKKGAANADLDVLEWVVAILCSGVGCIVGIIWMIQGKPKGGKMFGISLLFIFIWTVIRILIAAGQHGGVR